MPWHPLMRLDDLWVGEMVPVRVGERQLVLLNVDGDLRAYDDRCRHLAFPLSRGRLQGSTLTCSAHEWQYDARTGRGLNPAGVALRGYPVRVLGDNVEVDVGDE